MERSAQGGGGEGARCARAVKCMAALTRRTKQSLRKVEKAHVTAKEVRGDWCIIRDAGAASFRVSDAQYACARWRNPSRLLSRVPACAQAVQTRSPMASLQRFIASSIGSVCCFCLPNLCKMPISPWCTSSRLDSLNCPASCRLHALRASSLAACTCTSITATRS